MCAYTDCMTIEHAYVHEELAAGDGTLCAAGSGMGIDDQECYSLVGRSKRPPKIYTYVCYVNNIYVSRI